MGNRAEQAISQTFALDLNRGLVRIFGEIRSLNGDGELVGEGLQKMHSAGIAEGIGLRDEPEHADAARSGVQRQIEGHRSGKRIGAFASGLTVLKDPLRDGQFIGSLFESARRFGRHKHFAGLTRADHDGDVAPKHVANLARGEETDFLTTPGAGELFAEVVQGRGSSLSTGCRQGLLA